VRRIALAAGLAVAGCSSLPSMNPIDWFSSAPNAPKPVELPALTNPQNARLAWQAAIGGSEPFVFNPALAGDSIYVAARDGSVARLDAESGKVVWRVAAGTRLSAGVGSDGALAVVATDVGEVIALDAQSGAAKWRARVSSEVLAAPKLAAGLVLVRSADSRIFAFDALDGKRRWVYQRAASALGVRSPAGVTAHEGSVYAGFSGGKLVAVGLANGATRWEGTVSLPKGATELERVTDVGGDPAIQGREVCAAAYQGRIACFDLANGNPVWARDLSALNGASLDARFAFVSDDQGSVHALDRTSGKSVWKQDRLAHRRLTLPLPVGGQIVVGDLQGYVHLLARESGAFVGRMATDGTAIAAPPVRLRTGFLVQTRAGNLYAFALQ
jgi:outer membrane protein assembly factor BamB